MPTYESDGEVIFKFVILLIEVVVSLILIFVWIFGGLFIDKHTPYFTLESAGYSQIHVREFHWFAVGFRGCGELDQAIWEAQVINPAGNQAQVLVCAGWPFKGATIRYKLPHR